jgi:hypothetical protein
MTTRAPERGGTAKERDVGEEPETARELYEQACRQHNASPDLPKWDALTAVLQAEWGIVAARVAASKSRSEGA